MKKVLIPFLLILLCGVAFGQTNPHWLQIQGKPSVSVLEFKVTGDGVTDDTANFQKAIDFAVDNDRSLYVPEGVYLVSDLEIGGSLTISGAGMLELMIVSAPHVH